VISLALSLALASSGFCNPLPFGNLELEARVGIEPRHWTSPKTASWKSTAYSFDFLNNNRSENDMQELLVTVQNLHTHYTSTRQLADVFADVFAERRV
jgi:hypothetical protein